MEKKSAAAPPRQAAAAEAGAEKEMPTTLLDAYEVECIRRELHRFVMKQNQSADTAAAAPGAQALGHHHSVDGHRASSAKKATSAKRVSPSLSPLPLGHEKGRRGVRLLGRHAVGICSGTLPLAAAPVGGRWRRAVAICGGGTTAPVDDGKSRRPRGGYREVEKV
ncbi:hypothetical protein ZEAMMB73_Zm00001d037358 [Zea mays]|jgi:hypothetical protein|uniref:Uncharacterized protein n=1 Tax=Zea mays TaxID=4577 RepID=A0A1D6LWY6_MAIZE|nr:hypothetical protein ZEAMMB73_Zm00001d037358 [Zea mays]